MEDKEKFEKERQEILEKMRLLEQQKNNYLLRLAELQGILKYLEEKECSIPTKNSSTNT